MNKTELVKSVSASSGLSKADTERALGATIQTIIDAVKNGEKVQIAGFGTFEQRFRSERQGRNPYTNNPLIIPSAKVPAFKAGKSFKDVVAGK